MRAGEVVGQAQLATEMLPDILEASLAEFVVHGDDATLVRTITKRVGVTTTHRDPWGWFIDPYFQNVHRVRENSLLFA
ncbi:hypothetical protein [Arthrobacter sp. B6]|uniref:hypothetical protein n=1 Tax=Arthrobacter sp. B6 TaxID=1570137 RepID=UPI000829EE6B|nr:hypothetical protein [Arthrobacter sp. B6]